LAVRPLQLSSEADPILDSAAAAFGGAPSLAVSELLVAHESIESFLDEVESLNAEDLIRQRDRSAREFRDRFAVSWEEIKLKNGL
jgi:hypothetical protein